MGVRVVGAEVQEGLVVTGIVVPAEVVAIHPLVVVVVDRRNSLNLDEVDGSWENQPSRCSSRAPGERHSVADVAIRQSVRRPSRLLVDKAQNERPPRISGMERKGSPL